MNFLFFTKKIFCLFPDSGFSDDDLPALLEVAKDLEEFYIVGYDYPSASNPLLKLGKKCKLLGITNTKKFTDDMLKEVSFRFFFFFVFLKVVND